MLAKMSENKPDAFEEPEARNQWVLGLNKSGFKPFDTRVLVLPDQVADKIGSILLPEARKEREAWAMTKATLIAVGSNAFIEWGDDADKPVPGDSVLIAQYAGKQHEGTDGQQYRVCKDEDILALIVEPGK